MIFRRTIFIFLSQMIILSSYADSATSRLPDNLTIHSHIENQAKHSSMAMSLQQSSMPMNKSSNAMSMQMKPSSMPMNMHGLYGLYPMSRESSGTSWQPQSTPMPGLMLMTEKSMSMLQGFANLIYDHQGGPRGDHQTFSTSMLMLMAQRDLDVGILGFHGMLSLDPLMGANGYPLLFQTGETANGRTELIDRQHPHDAVMELAATYSLPFAEKKSAFLYVGWPGEPALGPPNFMMRWSALDNPEAPLTHHLLDSTHISYGVVTLGAILNSIKLEASVFNGREPDQSRWNIESPRLSSHSARVTYNPNDNWSLQGSYGHLKSPEQLQPNMNTNRATISVIYNQKLCGENNWQTTLAWGQNQNHPGHTLNGYLLESTVNYHTKHTFFGRLEHLQRDSLFEATSPLFDEIFTINKLSVGYLYEFPAWHHAKPGLGGLVSAYVFPASLHSAYGSQPFSYMLFGRISIA